MVVGIGRLESGVGRSIGRIGAIGGIGGKLSVSINHLAYCEIGFYVPIHWHCFHFICDSRMDLNFKIAPLSKSIMSYLFEVIA